MTTISAATPYGNPNLERLSAPSVESKMYGLYGNRFRAEAAPLREVEPETVNSRSRLEDYSVEGAMYGLYGDRFQSEPSVRVIAPRGSSAAPERERSPLGDYSVEGAMYGLYGNRFPAAPRSATADFGAYAARADAAPIY
ncbi:MAG: hypothetical protein ACT4TC_08280 [Myxococcaceae bacterium]